MVLVLPRLAVYSLNTIFIKESWNIKASSFFKKYSIFNFNNFIDLVVVDIPRKENRFIIKYLLLSFLRKRLELVFEVNETSIIKSVGSIFKAAY
jgi:NADH:ubiquinone oxidoreductase subunit C